MKNRYKDYVQRKSELGSIYESLSVVDPCIKKCIYSKRDLSWCTDNCECITGEYYYDDTEDKIKAFLDDAE